MSWSGWGNPAQSQELTPAVRELLRSALGIRHASPRPASIDALTLTPPRLGQATVAKLASLVGDTHLLTDHESRVRHAIGRSTPELLTLRDSAPLPAPDLVLSPGSHEQVLALLALCTRERVAVVPFGGGTSVVSGLTPEADRFSGWVALDLRRLNALVEIDETSRLARLEPGLRGPEAEAALGEQGFTLGHFPQSFEYASLGGFAAARSSGQASAGYGRFDELVMAMRVAAPAGTLDLGRAPRSAAGPDLRQLILGSEGALGVITELTTQIRPAPERRVYDGWRLPSFAVGVRVLRGLAQDGPRPTVLRLSDEAETALGLARPEQLGQGDGAGCLAVIGFEGTTASVATERELAGATLRSAGAEPVADAGEQWSEGRYATPYLRDALLDAGALVETLETATWWSCLPALYAAVGDALREALDAAGTPPVILAHISHVYPAGASLYFTVACAQAEDPAEQWRAAKRAALNAIVAAGGSISHHHGVGRDHRPWLPAEIGELGVEILRAVKGRLDPAGILNPGILVEP
jgi:alkyldihydroxyacetonephosphate synthase